MRALVRAELIKLRSTRLPVLLLAATLGLVVLTVATSVPGVFEDTSPQPLDDPRFFAVLVGVGFGVPQVMMALMTMTTRPEGRKCQRWRLLCITRMNSVVQRHRAL